MDKNWLETEMKDTRKRVAAMPQWKRDAHEREMRERFPHLFEKPPTAGGDTQVMHHYTESGLDIVYLDGIGTYLNADGEARLRIPAVGRLHRLIVLSLAALRRPLRGNEIRVIRTEMGMTRGDLERALSVSAETLEETPDFILSEQAEKILRLLTLLHFYDEPADITAMLPFWGNGFEKTEPEPLCFRFDGSSWLRVEMETP